METLYDISVHYWVEVVFGLVVAAVGFFFKRYITLEKANRKKEQEALLQSVKSSLQESISGKFSEQYTKITEDLEEALDKGREESKSDDAELQVQISDLSNNIKPLRVGLLSIQGKNFKETCRKLLSEEHEITLDEWEELCSDHEAYNSLGGNHKGDQLYELVKKKVEKSLIPEK